MSFNRSDNVSVYNCNKLIDVCKTFISSSEFRYVIRDLTLLFKEIVDYEIPTKTKDNIVVPNLVKNDIESRIKNTGETLVNDIMKEITDRFYNNYQMVTIPESNKYKYLEILINNIKIISSHADYKLAISDLIDLFNSLVGIYRKNTVQPKHDLDNYNAQQGISNTKNLLENFANRKSLDPIIMNLKIVAKDVSEDSELRNYLYHCGLFMEKGITDSDFVNTREFTKRLYYLIDYGKNIISDRYQISTETLLYEIITFLSSCILDSTNSKIKNKVVALSEEMFLDGIETLLFKPEFVKDLAILLPSISEKLSFLQIPKIETEDNYMHVILDNIIIKISTISPKNIKFSSSVKLNTTKIDDSKVNRTLHFTITDIEATGSNISYFLKKKTGLIKVHDSGLADFIVSGVSLDLEVDVIDKLFKIDVCNASIDNLSLKIHDSKHDILYNILRPLIEKIAKSQIVKQIETQLKNSILKLNLKM